MAKTSKATVYVMITAVVLAIPSPGVRLAIAVVTGCLAVIGAILVRWEQRELKRRAVAAQADYAAALEQQRIADREFAQAKANYEAAVAERERIAKLAREDGWLVVTGEDVSDN